ncbi:chaperone protein ClpD, chloroplastic-like [Cucurbita moschata]|uniref:Chaperone protein ClpD, chloroplastic-like n=1 Tax=Cucurbita moschata TaxID=3662 RepID=A0A6J1F882_CUCMO|nr:chaperone protein ClpD, chloroplastic-like [Cucurbita moschata]
MPATPSSNLIHVHGCNRLISPPSVSSSTCSLSVLSISHLSGRKINGFPSSNLVFSFSRSFLTSFRSPNEFTSGRTRRRRRLRIPIISAIFERFTERAVKAVIFSQREAKALSKGLVFTEHLLLGLIAEEEHNQSPGGFLNSGLTLHEAREAVRGIWHSNDAEADMSVDSAAVTPHVPFSVGTKRAFDSAVEYSKKMGHHFVGPEHLSIALLAAADDGNIELILRSLGVNVTQLVDAAISRLKGELAKDGREPSSALQQWVPKKSTSRKVLRIKPSQKEKENSALAQFCVDLTARASEGFIDPIFGRDSEVKRVVEILCRRTKNSPILIGESGVGKTAIAEGLALSIAQADAPFVLLNKQVMSLDIGRLVSGAKERGELEARVTALINEITESGNIILFIDEVHSLAELGAAGGGSKGSGLNFANLLKPSLGRGKLQCIASTTIGEYRKKFETDKALARRFQPVLIEEPSQENAVRMLLSIREKYEAHHNCRFTFEAINAAVYLSARYISDRYLPDKAIDLIDEAGSRARMEAFKKRKELQTSILSKSQDEYWQEIKAIQAMHEMNLANKLKDGEVQSLDSSGNNVVESTLSSISDNFEPVVVGLDDVAAVTSLWSGIPVQQLTVDESVLLMGLDEQLKKQVVGQDEAVSAISRAVKRSRVGLKDPDRPIAVLLFCGPTGVGKTELTKVLARCYFGSEAAMLRLDMSEYMERHSVSKLIGSPPGYLGYGDGGTLTEAIRRKPFTVVLLDEIEKAHPDVYNIVLQLFEDGHLTDSQGRRVSFKNALIVMTSNIGSTSIIKGRHHSIGFFTSEDESSSSYAGMKSLVIEELKGYFRPELLNRIDEIVVFQPLQKAQMLEILNLMLQEVKDRLMSLGVGLELSESVKDLICQVGYDQAYGARPLRRAITLIVEDPLSEAFLYGDPKPGDTFVVDLDPTGNPFVKNQVYQ